MLGLGIQQGEEYIEKGRENISYSYLFFQINTFL
jgi:hypothetical protein